MIYGSVCSGIEAATVAWRPLGWHASFFSEIEDFPRAVLAHHYPEAHLHGDFTTIQASDVKPIDLLVGGTPCQPFSVAGLRRGLDDQRGNLALEYLKLADRLGPKWLVWENVPGVLSSGSGRDFGAFLGGLEELGFGWAYRVLDAQFFGVPQRRRRVFVVACAGGDWRGPASVLFEPESMRGGPAPSRAPEEEVAGTIGASSGDWSRDNIGETLVPMGPRVRRLTLIECERLQGFPDRYTDVPYRGKPAADVHRYKALGNSMAVPVMRWIGKRIAAAHEVFTGGQP